MRYKNLAFVLFIGLFVLFSSGCRKNRRPDIPDKPTGPAIIDKDSVGRYITKAHDPNKDDEIRYIFDWADGGKWDTTDYYLNDSTGSATHAWLSSGKYPVKVRAQDNKNAVSKDWSEALEVSVKLNLPPNKPSTPSGPYHGLPNVKYIFLTRVIDPDQDSVAVQFDWGDGRNPTWTGFYASGDTIQDTVTYSDTGIFLIKVVARDYRFNLSEFSDSIQFHVRSTWSFITNETFNSSPALDTSGNRVTAIVIGGTNGYVYCLDTFGQTIWKYPEVPVEAFYSSPSVGTNGNVYIGGSAGNVHAIKSNGTGKWVYPIPGHPPIKSSPALDETRNRVYIGCDNDTLYAFNAANGNLAWQYGARAEISSSPAIAIDGAIIFGDEGDTGRIYILNSDSSERHVFEAIGPIYSSPTISGDKIYFAADTLFYALDTNATAYMSYSIRARVFSSPTIGFDGVIYFGDENGYLHALLPDFSGEVSGWPVLIGGQVRSSVAVSADNLIYIVGFDNYLYAYGANGNLEWRARLSKSRVGKQDVLIPSPVIGPDGWVYAGSGYGVYAFYRGTTLASTAWPMFRHDIRHTGRVGVNLY